MIVMRVNGGGGTARSFCRACAYCAQAVLRSRWLMASQNVVSTCPGPGVSRGNGVGEGEGKRVGEGIDVGEGEDPEGTTKEEAVAPWNKITPALSTRNSEKQTSSMTRVQSQ